MSTVERLKKLKNIKTNEAEANKPQPEEVVVNVSGNAEEEINGSNINTNEYDTETGNQEQKGGLLDGVNEQDEQSEEIGMSEAGQAKVNIENSREEINKRIDQIYNNVRSYESLSVLVKKPSPYHQAFKAGVLNKGVVIDTRFDMTLAEVHKKIQDGTLDDNHIYNKIIAKDSTEQDEIYNKLHKFCEDAKKEDNGKVKYFEIKEPSAGCHTVGAYLKDSNKNKAPYTTEQLYHPFAKAMGTIIGPPTITAVTVKNPTSKMMEYTDIEFSKNEVDFKNMVNAISISQPDKFNGEVQKTTSTAKLQFPSFKVAGTNGRTRTEYIRAEIELPLYETTEEFLKAGFPPVATAKKKISTSAADIEKRVKERGYEEAFYGVAPTVKEREASTMELSFSKLDLAGAKKYLVELLEKKKDTNDLVSEIKNAEGLFDNPKEIANNVNAIREELAKAQKIYQAKKEVETLENKRSQTYVNVQTIKDVAEIVKVRLEMDDKAVDYTKMDEEEIKGFEDSIREAFNQPSDLTGISDQDLELITEPKFNDKLKAINEIEDEDEKAAQKKNLDEEKKQRQELMKSDQYKHYIMIQNAIKIKLVDSVVNELTGKGLEELKVIAEVEGELAKLNDKKEEKTKAEKTEKK